VIGYRVLGGLLLSSVTLSYATTMSLIIDCATTMCLLTDYPTTMWLDHCVDYCYVFWYFAYTATMLLISNYATTTFLIIFLIIDYATTTFLIILLIMLLPYL